VTGRSASRSLNDSRGKSKRSHPLADSARLAIEHAGRALLSEPKNAAVWREWRRQPAAVSALYEALLGEAMRLLMATVQDRDSMAMVKSRDLMAADKSRVTLRSNRKRTLLNGWHWPRGSHQAFQQLLSQAVQESAESVSFAELGSVYEQLQGCHAAFDAKSRNFLLTAATGRRRKRTGSFYTPPELIACLLNASLDSILDTAVASDTPEQAILKLRVCDPACGSGLFLVAAAERMAARLAVLRVQSRTPANRNLNGDLSEDLNRELERARRDVVLNCLFGVDLDPIAVDLTRAALSRGIGSTGTAAALKRQIRVGNAIADSTGETAGEFRWKDAFPDPCSAGARNPAGFDLIVGNPPFVNVIELAGRSDDGVAARRAFPELGGTADRSAFFLARGCELVAPGGRVAFVLPRALLNSTALRSIRKRLTGSALQPNLMYVPNRCDFFAGAAVFVCGLVLGPESLCRISRDDNPLSNNWTTTTVVDGNWWRAAVHATEAHELRIAAASPRLGEQFVVAASMTAGDAYDLLPSLADSKAGPGMRLLTTGLIDPGESLWGRQKCRYLKRDFNHPRVLVNAVTTPSLRRRIERARRPKIVVAGLAARIECLLDEAGEYIGGVSTYTILHPHDDVAELRKLADDLLSREATLRFRSELGGNALGGGNITMTKSFLSQFPLSSSARLFRPLQARDP
jgi:hypothetical protein